MRSRAVIVAVIVVAASSLVGCSSGDAPRLSHYLGAYPVEQVDRTFVDSSRRTPPNGSYPGSRTRTLKVVLYLPEPPVGSHPRFPLVVFAPGIGATPADYDTVEEAWASAGYAVAGIQFPLSSRGAPGGPTVNDITDQPGDMKFVLGQLLALDEKKGNPVSGMIDANRIAVAGHSLGAITTLALVANTCCRDADHSIRAAVVMSGYDFPIPGGTYFPKGGYYPPMLSISGTKDPLATVPHTDQLFAVYPARKYQSLMVGAPHVDFVAPWTTTFDETVVAFLNAYVADSGPARAILRASDVPGLATVRSAK